ncbi:MAG: neutral/alkaline non-lysosomal ceramidase N-terminal domain-containing protein [Verrucomicrobiales bacterium]|nr:neutral/alkaline non-lysosomal ceramidase N-terminal domain-containing protein [Verrucomicrobiales bacterium]
MNAPSHHGLPGSPLGPRMVLLGLMLLAIHPAIPAAELQVGTARIDITPSYPIRLNGFGGRRTESEGVSQRIWAKALAFQDPATGPALIIAIDNLGVPDYIHQELTRRLAGPLGLKPERIALTATHTHTAPLLSRFTPTIFSVPIPPDHLARVDRYTGELIDAMERVALEAWRNLQPATLSYALGQVTFAANRRTKGGPVDHDLPVLAVRSRDGQLLAIYTSYACHCVTLSHNKISGDWAGYAQEEIERAFPGTLALTSVGCGADSNPSSGVTGDKVDIASAQGQQIAAEIQRLLKTPLKPLAGPLRAAMSRVILPFDKLPTRGELEEKAKRTDAVGYHARFNLAKLDRGEVLPAELPYTIQTWTLGNSLAMINLPGEVVVDYSLRLKREFDRTRLWVNGYANEAPCYIPSERILKEGGYEGGDAMIYYDRPTRFAPGLEQKIIDAIRGQIPADFLAPQGTDGTKPLGAADALRSFRVRAGLELELVASEPLVTSPVAIDWGADGRLWVCEMYDYPQGLDNRFQPGGRITFLQDTNLDGRYDRSQVFLPGIPFPTGVFAWGSGVLVCAAPDLLYAEDTDGDGKADRVQKLFSGFSTENYQARLNGLALGLDGWIYGANGLLGGLITNHLSGGTVDIRGRDFRFRLAADLSSARFETATGLSQQGRVRDDWDRWFGCDNSTLVHHYPIHDHYVRRNPRIAGPPPSLSPFDEPNPNRLHPISRALERFNDLDHLNRVTSACGIGIYRDDFLGAEFKGDLFTCEPVHNLVHRLKVVPQGAMVKVRKPEDETGIEFLASSDNWFRPVQVRTGPDGALWIVDMYRFLMEHPRWISPQRLASLDMRAGADRGRLYRLRPVGQPLRPVRNLIPLTTENLVASLDSANGTERDRVQLALAQRNGTDSVRALKLLARNASRPEVRAQALAASATPLVPLDALIQALKDPEPSVIAMALIQSELWISPGLDYDALSPGTPTLDQLWTSLASLSSHPDPRVTHQLALSLGSSTTPRAGELLAQIATSSEPSLWQQAAILTSAGPHAVVILRALLARVQPQEDPPVSFQPFLEKLLASCPHEAQLVPTLKALLPQTGSVKGWRLHALSRVLDAPNDPLFSVNALLNESPLDAAFKERLIEVLGEISAVANDSRAKVADQVAAVRLLGRNQKTFADDLLQLSRLATDADSSQLREAALKRLSRMSSPEIPGLLLQNWARLSPAIRQDLLRWMLGRESWSLAVLKAAREGTIQANELSSVDRERLSTSSNDEIKKLAELVLPLKAQASRDEVLHRYQSLPDPGNDAANRGRELFIKNCSTCHQAGGSGHRVGPDLDPLAGRELDFWVKNILDPNAVVEPRFVAYEVETRDGRSASGIVQSETGTSLLLVQPGGVTETFLRSELQSIRGLGLSLMPEGLEAVLPPVDFAALVGFLRRSSPPKVIAGQALRSLRGRKDGSLFLPASAAELRGGTITFERDFENIGMWHGTTDQATWRIESTGAGNYDVYLDYACAATSAGNTFQLHLGNQIIRGRVEATGPNWSDYVQVRVGSLSLTEGSHSLSISPDGSLKQALMDLRAIALVPAGGSPQWPRASSVAAPGNPPRDAASLARVILDPKSSEAEKEGATTTHPHLAAAILAELTRELPLETAEEYRRIPWIWRLTLLTARRNDAPQLLELLKLSLPSETTALRDWQAVALGGGIINGLSQLDLWPAERIRAILADDTSLQARWTRALELASAMAADSKVPTGTRYDALRMLGVEPWDKRGKQLAHYLAAGTNEELQMGAVSGLADMPGSQSAAALLGSLAHLKGTNRELALDAMLRGEERVRMLLAAVRAGNLKTSDLGEKRSERLREFPNSVLRQEAVQALSGGDRGQL